MRKGMNASAAFGLAATLLVGCGAESPVSQGRQGGAGASCLTTNDCVSPLECIDNVCVNRADATATADVQNEDAVGDDDIEFEDVFEPVDVPAVEDVPAPVELPPVPNDIPPLPDDPGPQPDGPSDVLNPVGDCEKLGVPSEWVGSFEGDVDYDLGAPIPGLIEKDILPVNGNLSFSIECIEQKLVVIGQLDGLALGANPFTMKLQGGYNPTTKQLTAKMVDAQVIIFAFVTVYFEGDFVGELVANEAMSGTWGGEATGNSVMFASLVADGNGTWQAAPK